MRIDLTQQESERAIRNAVAHQRLEGLEPDPHTVRELYRVAKGEIELTEVITQLHQRIASRVFFKPTP